MAQSSDISKVVFHFITNLRQTFNQGNSKTKANILLPLGKSITILDGKLSIEPNDWLVSIKENYQSLEEEFLGLKLSNIEDLSIKNKVLEPICNTWLAIANEVGTRIASSDKIIFIPELSF